MNSGAAWICLLAAVLLYAPLAGAAWLAHSMSHMDCCAGGYCPIAAHHHEQKSNSSRGSAPMDCGHEGGGANGMGAMKSCSMSCCPDRARPAVIPGAFLLPIVSVAPMADEILRRVQVAKVLELSRFNKPLSPPPRMVSPVL